MTSEVGRLDEAARESARSFDLLNSVAPDSPEAAFSELDLSQALFLSRRLEEAKTHADRIAERFPREMPESPSLATALAGRAEILIRMHRLDDADRDLSEASAILTRTGHLRGAMVVVGRRGEVLTARGEAVKALPLLERNLREVAPYAPLHIAEAEFEVAKARRAIWPGDAKAIDLARKADAVFAAQPSLAGEHERVVTWLATERRPRSPLRQRSRE
ncbi:MAG TPA: hypothetical protein VHL80_10705 [Polyangia bacterium]|nr:hypothetical protein [Polyangia bacterium]